MKLLIFVKIFIEKIPMSFKIETEKVLIWDSFVNKMTTKIKVYVGFFW